MSEVNKGYIYGILAFTFWGAVAPIYFKEVASVSPLEVLLHRVIWSFLILIPLLFIKNEFKIFILTVKDFVKLKYLFFSTFFISINWLVFIWAVANDKIIEASLGYYINPLVSVTLGFLFFSERLSKNQYFAIFIALLAIVYELVSLGSIPILSLVLAFSFAFYGMLRKKVNVGSVVGLSIETLILLPFSLVYLYYIVDTNTISFLNKSSYISFMLFLGGVVTVTPLLLFNTAARRMKLATLGFLQYIGPSLSFFVAIFIYKEEFSMNKLITFFIIWLALGIFSMDVIIKNKNK